MAKDVGRRKEKIQRVAKTGKGTEFKTLKKGSDGQKKSSLTNKEIVSNRLTQKRGQMRQKNGVGDQGLQTKTEMEHRKWLKEFECETDWNIVIGKLEKRRKEKDLKASTVLTNIGSLKGGLKRQKAYGYTCKLPLASQEITDYIRKLTQLQWEEIEMLKQAEPLPLETAQRLILNSTGEHRIYTMLLWALAGRPKDIAHLNTANVEVEGTMLKARFVSSKTTRLRGKPFTTHSTITPEMASYIQRHLKNRKQKTLFTTPGDQMEHLKINLNEYNKRNLTNYTTYSFRRGAAVHLAKAATPLQVISTLLGHTSLETTYRYVGWGWLDRGAALANRTLLQNLWQL
jgi:integrase